MSERTALYRFFDVSGALLYVGITVEPRVRWAIHAGEKTWWPNVTRKVVEWYDDRWQAEAAEVAAIVAELPRYNVEHSTTRKPGDAKAECRSPYDPPRRVRLPVDEWRGLRASTRAAGTTPARVIREFIRWYMRRPGATLPKRPDPGPWSTPAAGSEPGSST